MLAALALGRAAAAVAAVAGPSGEAALRAAAAAAAFAGMRPHPPAAALAAAAAAASSGALLLAPWQQAARHISSSRPAADLREFLDATDPTAAAYGRSWAAAELRNKSWDDLHKLWYVCLKERNMLLTQLGWEEREQSASGRSSPLRDAYGARYVRVKKTMNRIKQVLSERAHNEADAVKAADMRRVIHYM